MRGSAACLDAGLAQQGTPSGGFAGRRQDPAQRVGGLRAGRQNIGLPRQSLRLIVLAGLLIDPGQVVQRHGVVRLLLQDRLEILIRNGQLVRSDGDLGYLLVAAMSSLCLPTSRAGMRRLVGMARAQHS